MKVKLSILVLIIVLFVVVVTVQAAERHRSCFPDSTWRAGDSCAHADADWYEAYCFWPIIEAGPTDYHQITFPTRTPTPPALLNEETR